MKEKEMVTIYAVAVDREIDRESLMPTGEETLKVVSTQARETEKYYVFERLFAGFWERIRKDAGIVGLTPREAIEKYIAEKDRERARIEGAIRLERARLQTSLSRWNKAVQLMAEEVTREGEK